MIGTIESVHENHGVALVTSDTCKCPVHVRGENFERFNSSLVGRQVELSELDASSGRLWATARLIDEHTEQPGGVAGPAESDYMGDAAASAFLNHR